MSHYRILEKQSFKNDLREISNYIILNFSSVLAVKKLISEINSKIQNLKELPCAYPILYKYIDKSRDYRRIVVKNYSIIYYVLKEEKTVVIVHIYYNKRKFFNF